MVFGNIIINIKNINEALIATKYNATSIMLYDIIPEEIKNMNISGPQFQLKIINQIQTCIDIPLIVRIRIGNIDESKLLTKMGINNFYEKNIISNSKCIQFNKNYYSKINFINSSSSLNDIMEHYNNGTTSIKITGNNIIDTISTIQNIYNEIQLLRNNKNNCAYIKHKSNKYNTSLTVINTMIEKNKGPIPIYISNIGSVEDLEKILAPKHLFKLIDGIIIENNIFNLKHFEHELDNIITMYRKALV